MVAEKEMGVDGEELEEGIVNGTGMNAVEPGSTRIVLRSSLPLLCIDSVITSSVTLVAFSTVI